MAIPDERLRASANRHNRPTDFGGLEAVPPRLVADARVAPARLLDGKVILVTGASSGIGRAAATAFARHGARLVLAARREDQCQETALLVEEQGSEALVVPCDVTENTQVETLVQQAVAAHGRLDGALNNAGTHGPVGRTHELSEPDFDVLVELNLKSVWLCMRAELRAMLPAKRGAIVNIASTAGLVGIAGSPAYSATKHAVVGLTKSAALEYASKGIRVNALCPGVTRTPLIEGMIGGEEGKDRALSALSPMRRMATPEEIGEVAAFLLSDAAGYVTGSAVPVDGGWTAQ